MPIGEDVAEITPPPTRRQDQAQRDRRLLRVHAHWHAKTMASYSADHPVALREAHRLLDLRMRRDAILACIHDIERRSGEPPRRGGHGRFAMPSIRATLPWFRDWVLGELVEGRLVANMCLADGRRVDIAPERWGYLIPSWDQDEARYSDGEVVAREIIVRRQGEALSVPLPRELPRAAREQPAVTKRKISRPTRPTPVSDATLKSWYVKRMKDCRLEWRSPSQREDEEDAKTEFGSRVSRDRVRAMRKECAPPEWRRRKGSGRRKV
jgi:hypothetical protein